MAAILKTAATLKIRVATFDYENAYYRGNACQFWCVYDNERFPLIFALICPTIME